MPLPPPPQHPLDARSSAAMPYLSWLIAKPDTELHFQELDRQNERRIANCTLAPGACIRNGEKDHRREPTGPRKEMVGRSALVRQEEVGERRVRQTAGTRCGCRAGKGKDVFVGMSFD